MKCLLHLMRIQADCAKEIDFRINCSIKGHKSFNFQYEIKWIGNDRFKDKNKKIITFII